MVEPSKLLDSLMQCLAVKKYCSLLFEVLFISIPEQYPFPIWNIAVLLISAVQLSPSEQLTSILQ